VRVPQSLLVVHLALLTLLLGCAGTRVRDEPLGYQTTQAIASASDVTLAVHLEWIIVRDGPGSWAKGADWDEYILRVHNEHAAPVTITGVSVVDLSGAVLITFADREKLVRASEASARRHRALGIETKAGSSPGVLLGAAGMTLAAAPVIALSAISTGSTVLVAGTGLAILAPVALAGGAAHKYFANRKVEKKLLERQTPLPLELSPTEERRLDLFFPIAPSPQRVIVEYEEGSTRHTLEINTGQVLEGLHIPPTGGTATEETAEDVGPPL
jgi:hypothetical protein